MCTAFVRCGKDMIYGFNMDINLGAFEYKVFAESDKFYVGIDTEKSERNLLNKLEISDFYHIENHYRKVHGVNKNGNFGNCLGNLNYSKAPFSLDEKNISIDQLADDYISGIISLDDMLYVINSKELVNAPTGSVGMPDFAMHSLFVDKEGRIVIVEPGNGYSVIREKYAVLSNFSVLEPPLDMSEENYGFYGKDRYDKALYMLMNSNEEFGISEAFDILGAVKQEGEYATRVSFVYSGNENAVYYAFDGNFSEIRKYRFIDI